MINDEIKEAIEDVKRYFGIDGNLENLKGLKTLLSLAQSTLNQEVSEQELEEKIIELSICANDSDTYVIRPIELARSLLREWRLVKR
jgi:hypothetical protein